MPIAEYPPFMVEEPATSYTSDPVFTAEMRRIFETSWIAVGATDRLAAPGDYFAVTVGNEPLLIVRGDDGAVHAHINVCRHRGTLLCKGDGSLDGRIVCPNHGWSYSLAGELTDAPLAAPPPDTRLFGIQAGEWGPSVFVNFDPGADPLSSAVGDLPANLARLDFSGFEHGCHLRYDVPANWKILAENLTEAYHIPFVHPSLAGDLPIDGFVYDEPVGPWSVWEFRHPEGGSADERGLFYYRLFPNFHIIAAAHHVISLAVVPRTVRKSELLVDILVEPGADPGDLYDEFDSAVREDIEIVERMQLGQMSRYVTTGSLHRLETMAGELQRRVADTLGERP